MSSVRAILMSLHSKGFAAVVKFQSSDVYLRNCFDSSGLVGSKKVSMNTVLRVTSTYAWETQLLIVERIKFLLLPNYYTGIS